MKLVPNLIKLLFALALGFILWSAGSMKELYTPIPQYDHASIDAYFLRENKGQLPDNVLYRFNGGSKVLYLEEDGFMWHVLHPEDFSATQECKHGTECAHDHHGHDHHHDQGIRQHVFKIKFKEANAKFKSQGVGPSPTYSNYFRGNDQSRWASEVRDYMKAELYEVYDNIDLHFYQNDDGLKYDWIVHPGGDPDDIVLEYQYLEDLFIKKGKLYQVNSIDTIIESAPYAYQIINGEKKEVKSSFALKNKNELILKLGKYHRNLPLVIDPTLVFSSYTGSTADNWGSTATPGSDGSFYAGGIAFDVGYPTFNGSYDPTFNPSPRIDATTLIPDIAISKFTPDGSNIVYSTYLGGNEAEFVHSIIENSRGELAIYGTTSSRNYPTTTTAFQSNFRGGVQVAQNATNGIEYVNGADIVVTVLNQNGSALVGSTFVGGSANDGINNRAQLAYNYGDQFRGEIIVDDQDNIYIASCTQSGNFPVSSNAASNAKSSDQDACIFSMNRTCSNMRFSTFIGGDGVEAAYSLKRNSAGNIIAVGGTTSNDFPTTSNAIERVNFGGSASGFITIFNNDLSGLVNSTFVSTDEYDQCYLVALDEVDQIYVAGQSDGPMGMSTGVYGVPNSGQFIHIYEPDLSAVRFNTVFGTGSGAIDISLTALNVDFCRRIFISGWGGVTNSLGAASSSTTRGLQVSPDAEQPITDGSDFYFLVLEKDFESMIYATYFGRQNNNPDNFSNDHVDGGTSRFGEDGSIYQAVCAGCGGFSDFPTTGNAYSRVNGSQNCNLAAVKLDFELDEIVAAADLVLDTFGCAPYNAEFINFSRGADSFVWTFGDGESSIERSPNHQYDSLGTYPVRLIASSSFDCLDPDTIDLTINIIAAEPPNLDTIRECDRNFVILESSRFGHDTRYIWEDGITTSRGKRVLETGVYAVSATESNCVYIDSFFVTIINPEVDLMDSIICGFFPFDITLDSRARDINWSTGSNDRSITIDQSGLYTVDYLIDSCYFEDTAYYFFATIPDVNITGDTVICGSSALTITAENQSQANIGRYSWSSGQNTPSIDILDPGDYSVTVTSDSGCVDIASVRIIQVEELPELISGDSLVCNESELTVDFSEFADFSDILWDDGSTQSVRTFSNPGTYSYTISNFCETRNGAFNLEVSPFTADERPIYIPNAFTPNEDNTNDVFKPEVANEITILDYRMMVFDRWGNKVFESRDVDSGWDGTFRGEIMDPAIYAYTFEIEYFLCESPKEVILKGDVNLQK